MRNIAMTVQFLSIYIFARHIRLMVGGWDGV